MIAMIARANMMTPTAMRKAGTPSKFDPACLTGCEFESPDPVRLLMYGG